MTTRQRTSSGPVAAGLTAGLLLAACGNDDESSAGGDEPSSFSTYNCEPQTLTPGMSSEVCGAGVLEQLFTGLTEMDYDAMEPVPGVAESWDSQDNITWEFQLAEGWEFHNGEPVTAQTFVDTFNWTADPQNAQGNAEYYEFIEGYSELTEGEADELSGVRAIDDTTLEIVLNEPFGQLPELLSLVAFSPLPEVVYEDMTAFENAPIGNGRYQMKGEWDRNVQIAVERYEDWPGEEPGHADAIEFQIYSDTSTAYQDVLAGNLDLLYNSPPENIPMMESDFGENQESFETGTLTFLGLPTYQPDFEDPDVRRALSMAVDREEIIDTIFDGALTPARSFLPPVLSAGREDACEYCVYDPETAAELYTAAGGPSELTVYFNSGAGHDEWVEAVTNQWGQNLPIEEVNFQSLEFAPYLDLLAEREIEGPYRLGWTLSYPSPQESLEPMYSTTASRNYTGFDSEEFNTLIAEANATDAADADAAYQVAEDVLLDQLPAVPLWFESQHVVWNENLSNVQISTRGLPQLESVEVN